MNRTRLTQTSIVGLFVALLATPAEANSIIGAIPFILFMGGWGSAVSLMIMVILLIPIVVVEAFVLGWQLGGSIWVAIKVAFWANLWSTMVGIPWGNYWLREISNHCGESSVLREFSDIKYPPIKDSASKESAWKKTADVVSFFGGVVSLFGVYWLASCVVENIVAAYMLPNTAEIHWAIIQANSISYLFIFLALCSLGLFAIWSEGRPFRNKTRSSPRVFHLTNISAKPNLIENPASRDFDKTA